MKELDAFRLHLSSKFPKKAQGLTNDTIEAKFSNELASHTIRQGSPNMREFRSPRRGHAK